MTGVPRLQHLPVPAASAGALAVATSDQTGGPRVKAVAPVTAAQRHQQRQDGTADARRRPEHGAEPFGGTAVGEGSRQGQAARRAERGSGDAASGKLINFSRLSSLPFMVQVLGQQAAGSRVQAETPQTSLSGHRDAALLGSHSYRRAGGEPEFLPDSATFVRLAV